MGPAIAGRATAVLAASGAIPGERPPLPRLRLLQAETAAGPILQAAARVGLQELHLVRQAVVPVDLPERRRQVVRQAGDLVDLPERQRQVVRQAVVPAGLRERRQLAERLEALTGVGQQAAAAPVSTAGTGTAQT